MVATQSQRAVCSKAHFQNQDLHTTNRKVLATMVTTDLANKVSEEHQEESLTRCSTSDTKKKTLLEESILAIR